MLPRELANLPCNEVDASTLLSWLNTLFETNIPLSPAVENCLAEFTDDSCDLGDIYGYLRPWMRNVLSEKDFAGLSAMIRERSQRDFNFRSAAVKSDGINPRVPPRRVWDLYANRVLPYYALAPNPLGDNFLPDNLWGVSHTWRPIEERKILYTTINGGSWGIPMPRGATLDGVRNELLTLGAEYVWVDIICMRQAVAGPDQHPESFHRIRMKEWKLDVPTIGYMFQEDSNRPAVVYFNGLGIPFRDGPVDPTDACHWLNRGWALQEFPFRLIPAGLKTKIDIIDLRTFTPDGSGTSAQSWACRDFLDTLLAARPQQLTAQMMEEKMTLERAISRVNVRSYSNTVDQVASLAYILQCPFIPVYDASRDANRFWMLFLQSVPGHIRTELLFSYFTPPDYYSSWCPSWDQVTPGARFRRPENARPEEDVQYLDNCVGFRHDYEVYYHKAYVVPRCRFHKASKSLVLGRTKRVAYIEMPLMARTEGESYGEFEVSEGGEEVEENTPYLLISIGSLKYWVVAQFEGWRRIDGERAFQVSKVSTLTLDETHSPFEDQDLRSIRRKLAGKPHLVVYH